MLHMLDPEILRVWEHVRDHAEQLRQMRRKRQLEGSGRQRRAARLIPFVARFFGSQSEKEQ